MTDTPRPPIPLSKAVLRLPGGRIEVNEDGTIEGATAIRHCADPLHVFAEIPGECQCGSEWWGEVFASETSGLEN